MSALVERGGVQSWLPPLLARPLGVSPEDLDPRRDLADYGMDSVHAVRLACELSRRLGRRVEPTVFWEHPSVQELASHLEELAR